MFLKWPSTGVITLTIKLDLRNGVALDSPELYRREGQAHNLLPPPAVSQTGTGRKLQSTAVWTDVTVFAGETSLSLQMYWTAFDPKQASWQYTASVTVTDSAGNRLAGRNGHLNPTDLPHSLTGHWDHATTPIGIW
ncbi:MAG: hypothetical protein E6Q76_02085 [Rhizobium sp.]|nr:MAG: hypothetical protein E6Q76_02085 [Rhizobium sp.]